MCVCGGVGGCCYLPQQSKVSTPKGGMVNSSLFLLWVAAYGQIINTMTLTRKEELRPSFHHTHTHTDTHSATETADRFLSSRRSDGETDRPCSHAPLTKVPPLTCPLHLLRLDAPYASPAGLQRNPSSICLLYTSPSPRDFG